MVLDIICLVVIGLGCLIGYFKGLFKMASRLVSFALAILISVSCSGELAAITYDSLLQPTLEGFVTDKVEEVGAGEAVTQVFGLVADIQTKLGKFDLNDTLANLKDSSIGGAISSVEGSISGASGTLKDILGGTDISSTLSGALDGAGLEVDKIAGEGTMDNLKSGYDKLSKFFGKVSPSITNFIADKVDMTKFTEVAGDALANPEQMTTKKAVNSLLSLFRAPIIQFITPIFFLLCFLVSSLVLNLILSLVVKLLDKITLIDKVNHIGGLSIGAICALPFAIVLAFCFTSFVTPASSLYPYVDGSLVGKLTSGIVSHIDFSVDEDAIPDVLSNLGDSLSSQAQESSSVADN